MPTSTIYSLNLTASAKTANLLAGDVNEFIGYRAQVTIYQVISALGVRSTILADSDVVVDDKEIPFIGTTVDKSAHMVDRFLVAPGTRLSIFLRETAAAGTIDAYTVVDVVPV